MTRASIAETLSETLQYVEPPEPKCSCHIHPPCSDCVEHSHAREIQKELKAIITFMTDGEEQADAWSVLINACGDHQRILKAMASGSDQRLSDALDDIDDPAERAQDMVDALETLGRSSL